MKRKNWKIECKETGLFQFASSIGIARIKYDEMKARGLKPNIKKLGNE